MSWYNAYQTSIDIKKHMIEEQNNPNASVRKAGKVRVTQAFSNESAASVTTERNRHAASIGHGATNGFASSARQYEGMEIAWE